MCVVYVQNSNIDKGSSSLVGFGNKIVNILVAFCELI